MKSHTLKFMFLKLIQHQQTPDKNGQHLKFLILKFSSLRSTVMYGFSVRLPCTLDALAGFAKYDWSPVMDLEPSDGFVRLCFSFSFRGSRLSKQVQSKQSKGTKENS